jgi:Ca2+-binding EF-hand superfamily protein
MIRLRLRWLAGLIVVSVVALIATAATSFAGDETTANVTINATASAASTDSASAGAAAAVESPRADYYDVIFFATAQPIFLRFHIETDQKRLSDAWQTNLTDEFQFLDRDKNGKLETAELARSQANPQGQSNENAVLKSIGSILGIGRGAAAAADPGSPAAFAVRMRQAQPEFDLNVSANGATAADRLFASLDQNSDGQISGDERATGVDRMTARDLDDDETLSLQELAVQPYPTLNFNNFTLSAGMVDGGSTNRVARFVTIRTPLDRQECAERWIRDYGKNDRLRVFADSPMAAAAKQAKLEGTTGAAPLGLMFLDAAALVEVLKQPPIDMELLIRLGKKEEKESPRVAFITPDGATLPKDAHGIKFSSTNGSRVFETATERVELTAASSNGTDQLKQQYKENFKQADMDNKKEAEQNGDFNGVFELIDANGDEKIFEEEYFPWLERQLASSASRAVLTANDAGHPFFPLFDSNTDGRLGLRELRVGTAGLLSRDANGDGSLSEKELVHLYRLSVGPAQVTLTRFLGATFSYSSESDGRAKPTKGPEWFRNMDRNQDGDVSRREFLGTAESFKALDRDGDDLIDGKEAAVKKK